MYRRGKTRFRTYANRRRIFKRRYPARRRFNTKRILRRRPLVPEIKWANRNTGATVAISSNEVGFASPTTLSQGAGEQERVGQEVMFRKINIRMVLRADTIASTAVTLERDFYVRLVFWTPRINYTDASAYMTLANTFTIFDWNTVTIHSDKTYRMNPGNMVPLTTAGAVAGQEVNPGPSHNRIMVIKTINFPRKAKFNQAVISGSDSVNPQKDILWFSIYNGSSNTTVTYSLYSKITYTDA